MHLTYKHTKRASYIGYITQAIVNNLLPLLFVTFHTSYAISLEKIGLLVSINFGVQIFVDLLAVRYIDRIGYRAGAVAAHMFAAVGLICLGILPEWMADKYAALVICVSLTAVGGGLTEVLISPIIESLPGDEKASAMSLLHSFYCWGHMAVVILSTAYFTLAGIANWRYLPIIWAIVPAFNTFLFAKVPLRVLVEESARMPVRKLFSSGMFWLFLALMVCAGASEQAMSQWSSLFAERGLQVSKTMGDLLGPCMFAAMMGLSRLFYGIFGARLNVKHGLVASAALCVASYILAVTAPWALLSLAGCALCGFSVGLMWPGTFSLAARDFSTGGTAMFALLALAGDVGCSLGPGVVGAVSGWMERLHAAPEALKIGIAVAIVFPILMLLGVWTLGRMERRHGTR
ncbi:MAG: MFS transporter [Christensenellales bacterium]|jgi:MFS family permease